MNYDQIVDQCPKDPRKWGFYFFT